MNWLFVLIAGFLEVVWATALKGAETLLDWTVIFILIAVSFILLIRSYRKIPMASAYTVFVGIGTVGTYVTGMVLGEPFSGGQIFFLTLLLAGIIGMKLFTKEHDTQSRGEH
ncbi:multidrug efflux SMR transporter [Bacillus swezeyi]|uniref:QacE family quaternary ammonium compound efflux SMR transporter n=1 Tax=Bacillus swezeyi TaxID=1925020 RepID=A0A1R1QIR2_9BACI|nr:multidrug efflux SMR transporter [Bacillus swezeyi]MEC1261045.1 multidrug efflux SMR transporter [Bacillus swezeyi]MED1741110.1 multidrug efflux SMR transporter [Bacillus swezeyi]MED2928982.1 multidrug efflux SMR transporter [Bacillus swezeyi]MED2944297.1 multidrug efflux SMR transporter [Bacillus swezeyi]MED2964504.1 multidrug efflux SMR transporter [Bacillus swezeyi]